MTQHFDSSITKITTDGKQVLSSFLEEGERLVSDVIAETRSEPTAIAATDAEAHETALGGEAQTETTPTETKKSAPAAQPPATPAPATPAPAETK